MIVPLALAAAGGAGLAALGFLIVAPPPSRTVVVQREAPCAYGSTGVSFGYLRGARFVEGELRIRVNPAWEVEGLTARILDHGPAPGDDGYDILDEARTLLTFRVPRSAKITILKNGIHATRVSRSRFVQLAHGVRATHLFEPVIGSPFALGTWGDTVCSLELVYFP